MAVDRQHILEAARTYVRYELESDSSGHDWWHIVRVTRTAKLLAAIERADEFVCELAALLHDIADEKLNASKEAGLRKVSGWLEEAGVNPSDREHIMEIVATMSFNGGGGQPMATLEGRIVQDADRLDAIGAVGIARTFAYSGWKGQLIYDPELRPRDKLTKEEYRNGQSTAINHFYEKLLKLKELMNTKAAQVLAEERHRFMEFYMREFDKEWGLGNESYIEEMLPVESNEISRVHVAFGEYAGGTLRIILNGLPGEKALFLKDDLMFGPLNDADDVNGSSRRLQWLLGRVNQRERDEEAVYLTRAFHEWKSWPAHLKGFPVVVWAGDSASEQIALRRLLAAAPEETEVSVMDTEPLFMRLMEERRNHSRLGTANEAARSKLAALLKEAVLLSPDSRKAYIAEWQRLVAENGALRVLEGGELKTVPEDYYDGAIVGAARKLKAVNGKFIMAARLVGEVLGYMEQRVGDNFIETRVRQLVERGILTYKGDLEAMRSYSVALVEPVTARAVRIRKEKGPK